MLPSFSKAQIPLGSSPHVSTRHDTRSTCRARQEERVEPSQARQPKYMDSTRLTGLVVLRRNEPSGIWVE